MTRETALPQQDGPNTHKYTTANHVTSWTVIPLHDPVTAIKHWYHVPSVVVEEIERAARTPGEPGLRTAELALAQAIADRDHKLGRCPVALTDCAQYHRETSFEEARALAAALSQPATGESGLREAVLAALEPECRGEDVCDVHHELLFDGRCEDAERDVVARVRAALSQPAEAEGEA